MGKISLEGFDDLVKAANVANKTSVVRDIKLSDIKPNPFQPRKTFDFREINELAESIKQNGLLQPIVVREASGHVYEIIAGERRYRATKTLEHETIPAIIREADDNEVAVFALIENIQRKELNILEEAQAYDKLLNQFRLTHQQVGERVGRSRSAITNMLRLLLLTKPVQELVEKELIDMGHARALLSLKNDEQIEVAMHVVEKGMTVRQTEQLVASYKEKKQPDRKQVSKDVLKKINRWCNAFLDIWDNKIDIKLNPNGKGKLIIHFDSDKDVEEIIEKLRS